MCTRESAEGEGAGLPSQLQDSLLGLVVMDPSNEQARRVVLSITGDGDSMGPVNSWRGRESLCTESFLQEYLCESGWLHAFNFLR